MLESSGYDLILHIDGASKGNPGEASIGIAIYDSRGTLVSEIGERIGVATNNVAEYMALLRGLEEARKLSARKVKVFTDSELLAKQISGEYKVKSENLAPLYGQALRLMGMFEVCEVEHLSRTENALADRLANMGLRSP